MDPRRSSANFLDPCPLDMPFPLHSSKMAFTWFRSLPLGFEEPACLCEVRTLVRSRSGSGTSVAFVGVNTLRCRLAGKSYRRGIVPLPTTFVAQNLFSRTNGLFRMVSKYSKCCGSLFQRLPHYPVLYSKSGRTSYRGPFASASWHLHRIQHPGLVRCYD